MRFFLGSDQYDFEQTMLFSIWLLDIWEGKLGGSNDGETIIEIPQDLLNTQSIDTIGSLIDFLYHLFLGNYNDLRYFQERAILAPKNEVIHETNDRLLSCFQKKKNNTWVQIVYVNQCESVFLHKQFDPNLYSCDVLNGL